MTKDSREIFEGLAIMETKYADQINSRPVIYFTFKDCKGTTVDVLRDPHANHGQYSFAIQLLTQFVKDSFGIAPILLIGEYDQPIMSSYENGYHDQLGQFFSSLYGSAMKGNPALGQALLTGVQRVAKESIFSQFNNARVYTALHKAYAPYFGLTAEETEELLNDYGLKLDESVREKYDGYRFGDIEMYNPWSIPGQS